MFQDFIPYVRFKSTEITIEQLLCKWKIMHEEAPRVGDWIFGNMSLFRTKPCREKVEMAMSVKY